MSYATFIVTDFSVVRIDGDVKSLSVPEQQAVQRCACKMSENMWLLGLSLDEVALETLQAMPEWVVVPETIWTRLRNALARLVKWVRS